MVSIDRRDAGVPIFGKIFISIWELPDNMGYAARPAAPFEHHEAIHPPITVFRRTGETKTRLDKLFNEWRNPEKHWAIECEKIMEWRDAWMGEREPEPYSDTRHIRGAALGKLIVETFILPDGIGWMGVLIGRSWSDDISATFPNDSKGWETFIKFVWACIDTPDRIRYGKARPKAKKGKHTRPRLIHSR